MRFINRFTCITVDFFLYMILFFLSFFGQAQIDSKACLHFKLNFSIFIESKLGVIASRFENLNLWEILFLSECSLFLFFKMLIEAPTRICKNNAMNIIQKSFCSSTKQLLSLLVFLFPSFYFHSGFIKFKALLSWDCTFAEIYFYVVTVMCRELLTKKEMMLKNIHLIK